MCAGRQDTGGGGTGNVTWCNHDVAVLNKKLIHDMYVRLFACTDSEPDSEPDTESDLLPHEQHQSTLRSLTTSFFIPF